MRPGFYTDKYCTCLCIRMCNYNIQIHLAQFCVTIKIYLLFHFSLKKLQNLFKALKSAQGMGVLAVYMRYLLNVKLQCNHAYLPLCHSIGLS